MVVSSNLKKPAVEVIKIVENSQSPPPKGTQQPNTNSNSTSRKSSIQQQKASNNTKTATVSIENPSLPEVAPTLSAAPGGSKKNKIKLHGSNLDVHNVLTDTFSLMALTPKESHQMNQK